MRQRRGPHSPECDEGRQFPYKEAQVDERGEHQRLCDLQHELAERLRTLEYLELVSVAVLGMILARRQG